MSALDEAYVKQKVTEHWNIRASKLHLGPHVAKSEAEEVAWDVVFRRNLPPPPGRVLDIGTGVGYLANVATRLGYEASGVDIAPAMIEHAEMRARELGQSIHFQVQDADTLPFDDGSFDAVTERHVLWTMPDPHRTLREILRVLRPGGHFLLMETKSMNKPTDPVGTALGGVPNLDVHYHEFRADLPLMGGIYPEEMVRWMEAAGYVDCVVDRIEEVHAARVAARPDGTSSDPARRMYLVRGVRPAPVPPGA